MREREQFLVTKCFFTGSWKFFISNKQSEFKLKKKYVLGFRNMQKKLKNDDDESAKLAISKLALLALLHGIWFFCGQMSFFKVL